MLNFPIFVLSNLDKTFEYENNFYARFFNCWKSQMENKLSGEKKSFEHYLGRVGNERERESVCLWEVCFGDTLKRFYA